VQTAFEDLPPRLGRAAAAFDEREGAATALVRRTLPGVILPSASAAEIML
jgi:hypothetical protein